MAIDGTIPDSQIVGVQQYSTQDPTGGQAPGVIVPPAVLQMLMKTSTALAPKPSAAPPHPQVTAPLAAIPLGYQFAFNQLTSPTPYGNTITAYRIYRNKTANQFSGAQLIRTITHDPTHQGAVTVQDSTGGNVTYFYFVTAVDSTGQESSTPGAFQASSVTSGTANPNISTATPVTVSPTTTSGVYAVLAEMTQTLTFKGNKVLLIFTASLGLVSNNATDSLDIAFFKDGVQLSTDFAGNGGNDPTAIQSWIMPFSLSYIDLPSAGSHTYDVRWKITGAPVAGTAQNLGTARSFQIVELG